MDKALVSGSSVDNNNKLAVIFRTEICENTINYAISCAKSGAVLALTSDIRLYFRSVCLHNIFSVLVLAVPAAWSPDAVASEDLAEIGSNDFIMNAVLRSDFMMWVVTKLAGDQMISFLGVPSELQQSMTPKERENTERLIQMIQPVSQRYEGIKQDADNHQNRQRIALEQITPPESNDIQCGEMPLKDSSFFLFFEDSGCY